MEIKSVQENQYIDLFGSQAGPAKKENTGFVAGGSQEGVDLFALSNSTTDTTTQVASASTTDTTTESPSTTDTTTQSSSTTDTTTTAVDLFGAAVADDKKPGRKPKYDFSDMSGYYEDRVKAGKFVKIEEDAEDGSKKLFVPKTPEDFDEVIDLQVNYKVGQQKEKIVQQVYNSKSPAWQAVLKYSELVDDPSEVVPFIQGVQTMESVAQVDESTPEGAEKVVRIRLLQKGDTPELVDEQINTLKAAEKLVPTAKVYKPLIIQQEQAQLGQMIQARKAEEADYLQMVETVEKTAIKAIETPLLGKHKMNKEEKALVYEMIAYPSEETKGYGIFSAIDNLFTKGDADSFETLKLISLLAGGKKDALINYISSGVANQTAANLQRTLRVASSAAASSGNDSGEIEEKVATVNRNQYSAKFGR